MKQSDVKTFRDLCASFFVLDFEPEGKPKKKRIVRAKKKTIQEKMINGWEVFCDNFV